MTTTNLRRSTDLAADVFAILRDEFFDGKLQAKVFALRDKLNTQDDPFDEALHGVLKRRLPHGVTCERATDHAGYGRFADGGVLWGGQKPFEGCVGDHHRD